MDFDTLYDTYAEHVYRTALHYSKNHHVAEEITQAVFMELYDCEDSICLENAESWFFTMAKNKTLNYQKKVQRELLVKDVFEEMGNIVHLESFDNVQGSNSVDDHFIEEYMKERRSQFLEKIYDGLYEKNDRWYMAVMGAYVLKIPQNLLAEKMGISLGALQLILNRSKKWIRKQYKEELDRLEKE